LGQPALPLHVDPPSQAEIHHHRLAALHG
jgi:hypothetical protein